MRLNFTLFITLLLIINADAQKITGIWRGYFSSSSALSSQGSRGENYKYEIQIDQLSTNGIRGVTYSYKTTVFFGKAEISGIYNPLTKRLILKENKLVDVKIGDKSEPCLMICYLDYSKLGKLEVLEGTFTSFNIKDKAECGSGQVHLERFEKSDFKKEEFLLKKPKNLTKTENQSSIVQKTPVHKTEKSNPVIKLPLALSLGNKDNLTANKKKQYEVETQHTEPTTKKIDMPQVLIERENNLVQTVITHEENVVVELYDGGTIDNDTISVYHNNQLVVSNGRLTYSPIIIKIKCSKIYNYHEFVIVSENLGEIPPNTTFMIVKSDNIRERHEINLATTERRNAKVIIKYIPKE